MEDDGQLIIRRYVAEQLTMDVHALFPKAPNMVHVITEVLVNR
jgi:hypothetical protein